MVIFGLRFKKKSNLFLCFSRVFGIGKGQGKYLLGILGLNIRSSVLDMDDFRLRCLNHEILGYVYGQDLRRCIVDNKKEKLRLRGYVGMRFALRLPVRGQRTKSNGKTGKKLNRL